MGNAHVEACQVDSDKPLHLRLHPCSAVTIHCVQEAALKRSLPEQHARCLARALLGLAQDDSLDACIHETFTPQQVGTGAAKAVAEGGSAP